MFLHGLKGARSTHIQDGVHLLKEPVKKGLVLQISDSIQLTEGAA